MVCFTTVLEIAAISETLLLLFSFDSSKYGVLISMCSSLVTSDFVFVNLAITALGTSFAYAKIAVDHISFPPSPPILNNLAVFLI